VCGESAHAKPALPPMCRSLPEIHPSSTIALPYTYPPAGLVSLPLIFPLEDSPTTEGLINCRGFGSHLFPPPALRRNAFSTPATFPQNRLDLHSFLFAPQHAHEKHSESPYRSGHRFDTLRINGKLNVPLQLVVGSVPPSIPNKT